MTRITKLVFKMKVVDGEAKGNHDTPMFVRTMRYMIFRPYWNLPVSIIKKETCEPSRRRGRRGVHDSAMTTR